MRNSRPVPGAVEWVLARVAPANDRESLLADLEEEAATRAAREGVARARRWCWRQLAGSFMPLMIQRFSMPRFSTAIHTVRSTHMQFWRRMPHDLAFSIRRLAHSPGFTAICVITLALGIGATTAVFTLVDQVMLRDLPVSRPADLYRLGDDDNCCVNSGLQGAYSLFSYDLYRHLRDHTPEFTEMAAFQAHIITINVRRAGDVAAEPLAGQMVSGNYFTMFGVAAVRGRVLEPADDRPGAGPVGVLSYRAWTHRFGSDPSVVGQTVTINNVPSTIVGLAPPDFYGDMLRPNPPDFWLPMSSEPLVQPEARLIDAPGSHWLYIIGRLRRGARPEQIAPRVSTLLRQWLSASPDLSAKDRAQIPQQHIQVASAAGGVANLRNDVAPSLRLLLAISATVLLIACANLANLLLARGLGRRVEFAVRTALGAPRGRLLAESMMESVVLACAGGLLGLIVAYEGARAIVAMAFGGAPDIPIDPAPSLPVLAFAIGLSVATGLVVGIVPSLVGSRSDPIDAMRGAGRVAGDRGLRLRRILVSLQVALSLALVACAGLLASSLYKLQQQDFGFRTDGRYVVSLNTSLGAATFDRLEAIYRRLPARVGQIPGVSGVAFSLYSPMEGDNWSARLTVEGHSTSEVLAASWDRVSPDYFETIGTRLVRGRAVDARDTRTSALIAVVNETFAKRFFGEGDPIGKRFGFADRDGGGSRDFEVVGVVGDAKYQSARDPAYATFFLPFLQEPPNPSTAHGGGRRSHYARSLELRLDRPVPGLEVAVRRALAEIDPGLTVIRVIRLDEQVARNFNSERLIATLATGFGAMALLLACLGLYGVTAQAVMARTREIGVRVAIGATRGRIVRTVLRGALIPVAIGFAVGIAAAVGAGRLLEEQLFGVSGRDPRIIAFSAAILGACAVVAAAIPAARAAGIDPVRALRSE